MEFEFAAHKTCSIGLSNSCSTTTGPRTRLISIHVDNEHMPPNSLRRYAPTVMNQSQAVCCDPPACQQLCCFFGDLVGTGPSSKLSTKSPITHVKMHGICKYSLPQITLASFVDMTHDDTAQTKNNDKNKERQNDNKQTTTDESSIINQSAAAVHCL